MNREDFMRYIEENYNVSGEALRLINNILIYTEANYIGDDQYRFLCDLLDGTIGLSDAEIRRVSL